MRSCDKDGLSADPVHVNARSSFQVVQVDVAVFGDEKDDVLFGTDLDAKMETRGYKYSLLL